MTIVYPRISIILYVVPAFFVLYAVVHHLLYSISGEYIQFFDLYYSLLFALFPLRIIYIIIFQTELIKFNDTEIRIYTMVNLKGKNLKWSEINGLSWQFWEKNQLGVVINYDFGKVTVKKGQINYSKLIEKLSKVETMNQEKIDQSNSEVKYKEQLIGVLYILLFMVVPFGIKVFLANISPQDQEFSDGERQIELTYLEDNFSLSKYKTEVIFKEITGFTFTINNQERNKPIKLLEGEKYILIISDYDYRTKIAKTLEPHLVDKYISWNTINVDGIKKFP